MGRLKAYWAKSILPFQDCSWRCVFHQQLPQRCQIQSRPTGSQCGDDLQCQIPWQVCVGPLLPQPLNIFMEVRWDMSGCYRPILCTLVHVKLSSSRDSLHRVLLAWQALDLEVRGKLNSLDGRCLFLVSSPLLRASLKPEQSCALTWFLLSSASIYSAKKSFCCLWEPEPQEEPVTGPLLALHLCRAPHSDQALGTAIICRVGFFPLLFLIRG